MSLEVAEKLVFIRGNSKIVDGDDEVALDQLV